MKLLTFADGVISLDGQDIPGIFAELRIDGKVRFDEQKVDGMSGKSKTPQGWEDSDIMASLYLTTDGTGTCYDKLQTLSALFRDPDPKADPKIYTLANRHAAARNIRQVVFSRLESAENEQTDEIRATLAFVEHRPPIVKTEASEAKTPSAKQLQDDASTKKANAVNPDDGYVISGDLQ